LSKLVSKKAKILDIATGYGFLPVELSKLGLKVECVDKYQEMIDIASGYMKKNNFLLKIYKADAVCLPMKANSYDLVTAQSIIEHFCFEEMETKLIPEIKRVTKKNGLILIHVPIRSGISIIKKFYRKNIKKDLPKWAIDDDGDATHKVWMSSMGYLNELQKQNLKIKYVRFNFIRSNETIAWMRTLNWLFGKMGMCKFHKMDTFSKIKFKILSTLGTSVVFVCQKNSI
jgi:ubiquinone/menaquinone biosynthesis C-methylase UbiE